MKQIIYIFFSIIVAIQIEAQSLHSPLHIPLYLAGNFAELRKNHFHMGLDFKTDNQENLPVYSVENGYISRILISSNGYGKALYINHPKYNITSVYAHLNEFDSKIQQWVDLTQNSLQKNTMDTTILAYKFPVNKGQQIALSGNTGGSHGPHLHFEIRNMTTEHTINPMHYFDQLIDTIKPSLNKIIFYQMEDNSSSFHSALTPKDLNNTLITLPYNYLGLAVSAMDKLNTQSGSLGIYALRVFEDNHLKFRYQIDSLDFSWQSHIKAMSDYGVDIPDIYKGFLEHCSFNVSDSSNSQNGIIHLSEIPKNIRIEIQDFGGNICTSSFRVRSGNIVPKMSIEKTACDEEILIQQKDFLIKISPKTLAEHVVLRYYTLPTMSLYEILKLKLLDETTPVLKPYQLIYSGVVDHHILSKIYLESSVDNKHKSYLGTWKDGRLYFSKIKNFGILTLKADLNPPIIQNKISKTPSQNIFFAQDHESEIDQYKLTINGEWRKLYYDEKNDTFIYNILREDKGKKFKALLEIIDKVGNKSSKSWELKF